MASFLAQSMYVKLTQVDGDSDLRDDLIDEMADWTFFDKSKFTDIINDLRERLQEFEPPYRTQQEDTEIERKSVVEHFLNQMD